MPYCVFCGKLCTTAPGLERHIARTPDCKKSSCEKFGQYANSIWDLNDVPANPNHALAEQEPNLEELPDFRLEEDIELAEQRLDDEERNPQQLPRPPLPDEPQPHPRRATEKVPSNEEVNNGGRYIEYFPDEFLAGATWGHGKPLFESVYENQKRVGGCRWAPFEDEDEWQLAEWLIRNVGQKQTDNFLKLPIVSFFYPLAL